jgi:hypothetical protein
MLAPFIAEYAVSKSLDIVDLARCYKCGLKYFLDRYNDREASALYSNYRGSQYYISRHRYEFWYTRNLNGVLGKDSKMVCRRKEHLLQILNRNNIKTQVFSVMDWGGDQGQHIPDIFTERFVYEISDAKPVEGVTKLTNMQEVRMRSFDIVMLCGVLEHCSDPKDMVRLISELKTKFLYILVPFEPFKMIRIMPDSWYRKYMKFISHLPNLRSLVDFFTAICRLKLRLIPPFGILMQHEHLNYFTKDSVKYLLIDNGFEPIEISSFNFSFSFDPDMLVCLARRK